MIVRVYDRANKEYFISEVYAIINIGYYEKFLVLQETSSIQGYRLIEYLNKSTDEHNLEVNINIISTNKLPELWISKDEHELKKYNSRLNASNKNASFFSFRGYGYVLKNDNYLLKLLKGKVLTANIWGKYSPDTRLKNWNYIEKEEDINHLMSTFHEFHDSVLRTLNYVSGSGKAENGGMYVTDSIRQVSMIFDSEWSESIEMVFEGVLILNLCPAKDNYCSDIFAATFEKEDEIIRFYTGEKESIQEYDGTWIESLGLRWRFI